MNVNLLSGDDCGNQVVLEPGSVIELEDGSKLVAMPDGSLVQIVNEMSTSTSNCDEVAYDFPGVEVTTALADDDYVPLPVHNEDSKLVSPYQKMPSSGKFTVMMPDFAEVVVHESNNLTVVARRKLMSGTNIGKVVAPRSANRYEAEDVFILKILPLTEYDSNHPTTVNLRHDKAADRGTICLDTSDSNVCNWLCLISTATSAADHNCSARQIGGDVYYIVNRDISVGEELKVWYDSQYAVKLGKSVTPQPHVKNMKTVRSRFPNSNAFLRHLLGHTDTQISECRRCGQPSDDLTSHICPALKTGRCSNCSTIVPSLLDHVCPERPPEVRTPVKKRQSGTRPPDPEWQPNLISAKPKRGRPKNCTGRRGPGRPRKYPIDEANIIVSDSGLERRKKSTDETNIIAGHSGLGRPRKSPFDESNFIVGNSIVRTAMKISEVEPMESTGNGSVQFLGTDEKGEESLKTSVSEECLPFENDEQACRINEYTPVPVLEIDERNRKVNEIYVEIVKDASIVEKDSEYQCPICLLHFTDFRDMEKHTELHKTHAFCFSCAVFFDSMDEFNGHICQRIDGDQNGSEMITSAVGGDHEHQQINDNSVDERNAHSEQIQSAVDCDNVLINLIEDFSCRQCKTRFRSAQPLLSHLVTCNPQQLKDMTTFKCEFCSQVFSTKDRLELHKESHNRYYPCTGCKKQFASEEKLDDHDCGVADEFDVGLAVTDRALVCGECNKRFKTQFYLNLHLNKHSGKFTCDSCEFSSGRVSELNNHKVVCEAEKSLKTNGVIHCKDCSVEFADINEYREHYQTHKSPFSCRFCGKPYSYVSALEAHQTSCDLNENRTEVTSEPVNCPECSKTFSSSVRLKRHMVFHSSPRFECTYCNRFFYRKDYYQNHLCQRNGTIVRAGQPPEDKPRLEHVCPTCGNKFASSSNRNKHMLLHKEKTLACDVCGKRFHLAHSLRHHKRYAHSEAKESPCSICGKVLKNPGSLRTHMRLSHSQNVSEWVCPVCDKQFNQRGNLLKHMLKHNDEKTFQCSICPKSFRYPEQYGHHMTEHREGRQFICQLCEKSFVKKYDLAKHFNDFHSGLRYVCEFCNHETRFQAAIRRHMKLKHEGLVEKVNSEYLRTLLRKDDDVIVQVQGMDDDVLPDLREDAELEIELGQQPICCPFEVENCVEMIANDHIIQTDVITKNS